MSGFLLDTNIPSEGIRTRPDPRVNAWVRAQDDAALHLSAITIGELRKGLTILPESKRRSQLQDWLENDLIPLFTGRILPVTQAIADRWGVLSGQRQIAGRPLSMADGLIAATALEHGLVLVTRNVRDYRDLAVTIRNPWEQL
jgi:predicted nucleic acid-binding protein